MAAANRKKSARGGKSAVPAAGDTRLANALADSSWAEADEALADALIEFAELKRAFTGEQDALSMASQALTRAARRRGLVLFGDVDATVAFDATAHELNGSSDAPARVRVTREGVMRGRDVLVRALVAPARKAAKRAPR